MKIIFCLPGNSFSGKFLECWTNLLAWCLKNGIQVILSRKESPNIYFVRNMCLGASIERGKDQKPFDGKLDYDYIMWIDSDILFTPQQFHKLLSHQKDIVSGVYLMAGGQYLATVKKWDEEFFKKHGSFQFMTLKDIEDFLPQSSQTEPLGSSRVGGEQKEVINKSNNLIDVAYTGMGFMLVKKGVFESMEYPWFRPIEKKIENMVDFTTEDVAFSLRAREKGFKIFIDPTVRVGHEKKIVY